MVRRCYLGQGGLVAFSDSSMYQYERERKVRLVFPMRVQTGVIFPGVEWWQLGGVVQAAFFVAWGWLLSFYADFVMTSQ